MRGSASQVSSAAFSVGIPRERGHRRAQVLLPARLDHFVNTCCADARLSATDWRTCSRTRRLNTVNTAPSTTATVRNDVTSARVTQPRRAHFAASRTGSVNLTSRRLARRVS